MVLNELDRVVTLCGSLLAHVFVMMSTEELECISMVVEDMGFSYVQVHPASCCVHKPHTKMLISERILLM